MHTSPGYIKFPLNKSSRTEKASEFVNHSIGQDPGKTGNCRKVFLIRIGNL